MPKIMPPDEWKTVNRARLAREVIQYLIERIVDENQDHICLATRRISLALEPDSLPTYDLGGAAQSLLQATEFLSDVSDNIARAISLYQAGEPDLAAMKLARLLSEEQAQAIIDKKKADLYRAYASRITEKYPMPLEVALEVLEAHLQPGFIGWGSGFIFFQPQDDDEIVPLGHCYARARLSYITIEEALGGSHIGLSAAREIYHLAGQALGEKANREDALELAGVYSAIVRVPFGVLNENEKELFKLATLLVNTWGTGHEWAISVFELLAVFYLDHPQADITWEVAASDRRSEPFERVIHKLPDLKPFLKSLPGEDWVDLVTTREAYELAEARVGTTDAASPFAYSLDFIRQAWQEGSYLPRPDEGLDLPRLRAFWRMVEEA